jgi:dolichol kinase
MSRHATKYLCELGFKAISIEGGIMRYKALYDPSIPEIWVIKYLLIIINIKYDQKTHTVLFPIENAAIFFS